MEKNFGEWEDCTSSLGIWDQISELEQAIVPFLLSTYNSKLSHKTSRRVREQQTSSMSKLVVLPQPSISVLSSSLTASMAPKSVKSRFRPKVFDHHILTDILCPLSIISRIFHPEGPTTNPNSGSTRADIAN